MQEIINMEQIRAAKALSAAKSILAARGQNGDQLSGYHSLIITNGLLATLAYSADKGSTDKGREYEAIALALLEHLSDLQRNKLFPGEPLPCHNIMTALAKITEQDNFNSTLLVMMTDECMAYLNYLKRFVRALKNS